MLHHGSTDSSLQETTLTALVPTWDSGEETFVFPRSGEFVCGRSPASAVRITVPGVAAEHCLVELREGRATILPIEHQLASVNGEPVLLSALLEAGDVVSIGPAQFRVEVRQPGRFCRPNVFPRKKNAISEQVSAAPAVSPAAGAANAAIDPRPADHRATAPDSAEPNASVQALLTPDASRTAAQVEGGLPFPRMPNAESETRPSTNAEPQEQSASGPPTADAGIQLAAEATANIGSAADASVDGDLDTTAQTALADDMGTDALAPAAAVSSTGTDAELDAVALSHAVAEAEDFLAATADSDVVADAVVSSEPAVADTATRDMVDPQFVLEEIEDLKDQLHIANADVDALRLERDELQTAVAELKTAFEAVRDELIASQAYVLTNEDHRDQASTDQSTEDRDLELQDALRTVSQQQDLIDALQQQMSDLAERFESEAEAIRREAQAAAPEQASADANLLEEVQQLRMQLSQAVCESSDAMVDDAQIDGYQQLIRDLKDQLQLAHQQLNQYQGSADTESYESQFSEFTPPMADAEESATRFYDQLPEPSLQESDAEQEHADGESLQQYVSERFGSTVEKPENVNSESDSEIDFSARKNFLNAFSALEENADSSDAVMQEEEQQASSLEPFFAAAGAFKNSDSAPQAPERPSVRSEIAELFGITNSAFQEKPEEERRVSAAAELMSAVDDYSQEDSAAVSMSFSEAEQVLLRPKSSLQREPEASLEEEDESHDDFVSQYMEQLLSRNRQSAGGSLPEELTRTTKRSDRSVVEKSAVREKPKPQASFIDQYMSGTYSQMDASVDRSADVLVSGVAGDTAVRPPRAKIDVRLLRQNMDSFREISSRSVENALATHARRRERGNLMKRATILGALSLLSVLIVVASMTGAIPFGIFAWLSIAAVVVSGGEFLWKLKSIDVQAEQAAAKFSSQRKHAELQSQPQTLADEPRFAEHDPSVLSLNGRQPSMLADAQANAPREHAAVGARGLSDSPEELYFEQ